MKQGRACADLNTADKDGYTALILAARNGHTDTARLLITKGANVGTSMVQCPKDDGTPLSVIRAALKLG